jgi:hypothetical protein
MYSWDQAARNADEQADLQPAARNGTAARNGSQAARNGQAHPAGNGHPTGNGQARPVHNGQAAPRHASAASRHAQAVQFSLDRRDNGGDAGRTR